MGYRPKRALFKLDFSETEHEGLEVTTRAVPMSVMLDVAVAAGNAAQDASGFRQVLATFAYALESWNVEDDDGQPVTADLDGLMSQDPAFVTDLIKAWVASMAGGS